jgi:methyltransferase (TIGR00027 family)
MEKAFASRTALTTSLIRAHHTPTSPFPLHVDPWGDRLVPNSFKDQLVEWAGKNGYGLEAASPVAGRAALLDSYLASVPSYASVIYRARYAEDELADAVAAGVDQYVQIGAGFDSFSLRRDPSLALTIFEIDHPATQSLKLERLAALAPTAHVRPEYVAADLAEESLRNAFGRSSFDFRRPTFASWLGVSVYLTREQNESAFRSMGECFAPGSKLVFTYTDRRALEGSDEGYRRMQKNAASMGEPFLSGFEPVEMAGYLQRCGLRLLADFNGPELADRYGTSEPIKRTVSKYSRLALAQVSNGSDALPIKARLPSSEAL